MERQGAFVFLGVVLAIGAGVLVGVLVPFPAKADTSRDYTCTGGPVPEKVQYVMGENSWQIFACWREPSGRSLCRRH